MEAAMREQFVPKKFQATTLAVIEQANSIITEYEAQGFTLSLRQLYYQFVSRDLIENTVPAYKRLGAIVNNGRLAGLIDWDAIEDRTRALKTHASWDGPEEIISAVAKQYQEDPWEQQIHRPEVWIEKAALLGVIEGVCTEYRVPYFASIGNNSQTAQYEAGKRLERHLKDGLIPVVLHLADHDPNGIDMTRDNRERLAMFVGEEIEVRRIALNIEQVEHYRPPPNFAKEADTRYAAYVAQFGDECWELDALNPTVIANLIRKELAALVNVKLWQRSLSTEDRNRALLGKVANNWAKVRNMLRGWGARP
jgi:hypothetical protein